MLIYNFQMGGDPEREGPGGNKNMINIPIKIEIHQDNNQDTGGSTANKVKFSEKVEVSFIILFNWRKIFFQKVDRSHSRCVPILIHEEDNEVSGKKNTAKKIEKV